MSLPKLPDPFTELMDGTKVYARDQMHVHAALAVEMYRQKLRAEFAKRHSQNQHHHNYYRCLVREIDDGLL